MNMETKIDQILMIVTNNQQDIAELKKDVVILKQEVTELKERTTKIEERITKIEERVTSLERSVFLIETRHGDKINALFDAAKANEDAHKRIEKAIENLRSEIQGILFSHDKRISNLENGNLVPSF